MKKEKINKNVVAELTTYYGGKRCIIDGNEHAEWHHFKEISSSSRFVDLVPLGSSLNSPVLRDEWRKRRNGRNISLPAKLKCSSLLSRSKMHFADWKTPAAYACARLAYYIGKLYDEMDDTLLVPLCCDAFYYARHSTNYDLKLDILKDDILPILARNKIGKDSGVRILLELAAVFSEHGLANEAKQLYDLLPRGKVALVVQSDPLRYAATLRRFAMSTIATVGITDASLAQLQEASTLVADDRNLLASIANTLAWAHIENGNKIKAYSVLEPLILQHEKRIFPDQDAPLANDLTAGNAAELFFNAGLAIEDYSPAKSRSFLISANKIFLASGWRPFKLHETSLLTRAPKLNDIAINARLNNFKMRNLPNELVEKMLEIVGLIHSNKLIY